MENLYRGVERMVNGGLKYSNIRIDEVGTERFPSMVVISKGPSRLSHIIGKKYIDLKSAVLAIDEAHTHSQLNRIEWAVARELRETGLVSIEEI
jgi:hypothetical protein